MLFKRTKESKLKTQSTKKSSEQKTHQTVASSSLESQKAAGEKGQGKRFGGRVITVGMKLNVIILCCVLVPVLVTGLVSLTVANNIIEKNAGQAAYETMQQTSAKIDTTLTTYEQIVTQFMTNLNLHEWLFVATNEDREMFDRLTAERDISELLNQYTYADPLITSIAFVSEDNPSKIFASGSSTGLMNFDPEVAWFQNVLESEQRYIWMHTAQDGYVGNNLEPSLAVARKMSTNYGQHYVLVVEISQQLLNKQVEGIELSDNSLVYVVNEDNVLLHSKDPETLLTKAELPLPLGGQEKVVSQEANEEYIVASAFSEKAGWYVVGGAPASELTQDTVIIRQVIIWIIIGAAAMAIVISYLVGRSIGGPLRKLQSLMMEGASGNLNVRTSFKNRDEIGQVGRSFNEMMEQIKGLVQQTNLSAAEVLATAQDLSSSAKETSQSAREISEATEQIANGASTLATEAERGNELVVDLSKQLEHVVEANRTMGEVASDVHKVSEQGTGYMSQLTDKTKQTEEMTRRMTQKVDQLKESTASIRNLLDMLTQITQQTNILALNASIEASRSGEAGRGFMVIAAEIRKLADQSRESIDVVAEMTEDIQNGIDETVEVMSEAYPLFQEQIASVKDADTIFNSVRERMIGLVQQADQVTEAIEQLEKAQHVLSDTMSSVSAVSEESSAISEEVASSSASQLHTSETLVQLVEKLESLSGSLTDSLKKFKI